MPDLPIACTLTASERRTREGDLLPGLVKLADLKEEIPHGWRYRFSPDSIPDIARAIENERRCCRFFRFQMVVEPDLGPVWLEVSGPPGTREFLAELLA